MSISSFIKKQFIDVIEWTESQDGVLAYRYPMQDQEIQNGAKLTVRESQLAMFVNEGRVADVFPAGLYTLTTRTLPILTNLMNWDKAFQSPFKSDVYYFSTREQLDQKWGTPQPLVVRDKEMGAIRIRAFGTYSYRLTNPTAFYTRISGTREIYTVQDLEGQLRSGLIAQMASHMGSADVSFIDMAANQQKFSDTLKLALAPMFASYGLELGTFFVQSITLPEELQQYFDKAANMRMVGDLGRYTQFQAAESLKAAAENPSGGIAGAGVGLGAGVALGQTMAQGLGVGAAAQGEGDPLVLIDKLHELMTKGVLSADEFNAKKAELLKRIK